MAIGESVMRTILFSGLLLLAPSSFAEELETAWVVDELVSQRFIEGETKGARFETDAEVAVLFREGESARIKGQAGFGWVLNSALTSAAPVKEAVDFEALMERMKGVDLNLGGAL